ncbi:MAG: TlpA disulfide reductase family protein, partial [Saprospiraceae bacterium]
MVAITSLHIQDLEGAQLPHFNGTTLNGIQIDDAYFRGRVSVIHFWFKGCEPCLEEIPGLNALAEHFKNQDVNFLAIGHEQTNIIEEFSRQHPLNFSQLTEGRSVIDKAFKYKASYP